MSKDQTPSEAISKHNNPLFHDEREALANHQNEATLIKPNPPHGTRFKSLGKLMTSLVRGNETHIKDLQATLVQSSIALGVQKGLGMAADLCASKNMYDLAEEILKLNGEDE